MDWGRVRFFLGEVARNFTRNATMQLTAVGTVTVTIVLLGSFLFVQTMLGTVGDQILHKIEISVFLDGKATADAVHTLEVAIAADPRVASVTYVSKAEGLHEMRARLHGQIDTSLLTSNPLPDALRVRVVKPDDVSGVAAHIVKMQGVANVNYAQEVVARALRLATVLGRIAFVVVALLVLVAAIIISNTIRLTVYSRRREIAIMQLVGATNAYIRGPFICEGFLAGLMGAAVALALLVIARAQLLPKLVAALPFLPLRTAGPNPALLTLELLGVGAMVGLIASWISVGRYLRT